MRIDFAIVGAPKCATTFIHQALLAHPEVYMDAGENAAFFGRSWLEKIAAFGATSEARGARVAGVKRPELLFDPVAPERMSAHNPDIKCIAVLRHPVARAVAHYYHLVSYSFAPLLDFEQAIPRLLDGELARHWPRSVEVLQFSHYRRGLEQYARFLGTEGRLLLTHDEVNLDARLAIHRVCEFLGLEIPGELTLPTERHQKVMYSLERLRFLRQMNESRMILDEQGRAKRFRGDAMTETDHAWVRTVKQFDLANLKDIPNVPPRLPDETWRTLYARFRDDIEFVEQTLGTDLPAWHRNPLT